MRFVVSADHDEGLEAQLNALLVAFSRAKGLPERNTTPVSVTVEAGGNLVGALTGCTFWGWLSIEKLWVDEKYRGQGLGRGLVMRAEREAISRGCGAAVVDTFTFQAQGFYEKLGYCVFGELADFPFGYGRRYMCKRAL